MQPASAGAAAQATTTTNATDADNTSLDQELYQAVTTDDMARSNQLLVHACSCDDAHCRDAEMGALCGHMKRFLRAACWASHDARWRKLPVASAMSELFTYHALHCQLQQCNVPLCRQLRDQVLL